MYFWFADRLWEGHGLLELAVAAASRSGGSAASRMEMLVALAYAAPGGGDTTLPHGTVAFGIAVSGDDEHAATLAEDAEARLDELEDHWAARVRSRLDDPAGLDTAEALAYELFRVARSLLEAWIAERRDEFARAADEYRRVLDIARRPRTGHEPSLLAAETARAPWSSEQSQAELARAGRALGHSETAQALHRRVVEWSGAPRPQQVRETFLAAPAGSPAAAALSTAVEAAG